MMTVTGDYGTALCAAFAHGRIEMVEYLLHLDPPSAFRAHGIVLFGLQDDVKLTNTGPFGGPLHIAVLAGRFKTVDKFINSGNDRRSELDSKCEAWIPRNR